MNNVEILDLDAKHIVADHIWIYNGKRVKEANIKKGNRIAFDARVKKYCKKYKGKNHKGKYDYKLAYLTNIVIEE